MMTKGAIKRIYVILDRQDEGKLETLCQTLSSLFSHGDLTSNLCLVAEDLREGMPQAERIQKEVNAFLRVNLFARLYVHFIHRAPQTTPEEADFYYQYYYQNWKRTAGEFDREAYMHQEVPRLMLLPVIVPDSEIEPALLKGFLDTLRRAFLLPSLYLDGNTFHLADDGDLLAKTEKVYYGHGNGEDIAEIACSLCKEEVFHDTSARLEPDPESMAGPCPSALIVTAQDGMVYGCMDAFLRGETLGNIYEDLNVDTLMDRCDKGVELQPGCLECRERVVRSFSDLPLPKGARHEVGDLLFHFGTLHQGREEYLQAAERYEESLKLSPVEETGPVHFRLGLCYTKMGRYDQGLESYEKAEGTYQDRYYFHFYMGLCYFEKEDFPMALERFARALDMHPEGEDLTSTLIYMGTCYNTLGEYEKAITPLERAKQEAGHVKEVYNALGFSYFQIKDYDKAIENLQVAVDSHPRPAIEYASLGANYRNKGDTTMAIAMYERALELDSTLAPAKENLQKLKGNHE